MKILKIDSEKTKGLRVFMVGFMLAASGFGIALLGAIDLGWLVIWVGGLTGLVGLIWHFWLMRSLFAGKPGLHPTSDNDRNPKE